MWTFSCEVRYTCRTGEDGLILDTGGVGIILYFLCPFEPAAARLYSDDVQS